MLTRMTWQILAFIVGWLSLSPSGAQEFRIYTKVYDAGAAQNVRPSVIGNSLSLFHAGKVYDHVENQHESEVIIFEPALKQFTILSTSRGLATTVHFDEINHKLKVARSVTERHLQSLAAQKPPAAKDAVEKVQFPIDPAFQVTHDPAGIKLRCESRHLNYRVRLADVAEPKSSEVYLNYADWMARLNYVLHPHALYPDPRLALNGAIRSTGKMPVEVELLSSIGMPIHLRAEHQIHWKLDATDRSLIHEWESLLKSTQTRHVTFQEYQRSVLVSRKD